MSKQLSQEAQEAKMSRIDAIRERLAREETEKDEQKARLAADEGIAGHPKLDALYSLAWQYGHSSGFSEVESYFREFAELLKP